MRASSKIARFQRFITKANAFSLVEVTMALGICAFGILAILGLLPVGLKSAQEAFTQSDMTGVLSLASASLRDLTPSGNVSRATGIFSGEPMPINTVRYFSASGKMETSRSINSVMSLEIISHPINSSSGVFESYLMIQHLQTGAKRKSYVLGRTIEDS